MLIRRAILPAILVLGLGVALTTVLLLLAAQVGYVSDNTAPFAALLSSDARSAILLSLVCATIASSTAMLVAIPAAYALARWRVRGALLIDALLDVPVILSPIVIGLSLILIFRSTPGRWIENHFVRFIYTVPGIIVAQYILALALEVRVLKATFEEIEPRIEQVARFLGGSPWSVFWHVTMPLSRSGLIAAFVLGWSRAMGDFGAAVTIGGAMPHHTETIPSAIYVSLASVQIDQAVQLSLVLTAVALAVLIGVRLLVTRARP